MFFPWAYSLLAFTKNLRISDSFKPSLKPVLPFDHGGDLKMWAGSTIT